MLLNQIVMLCNQLSILVSFNDTDYTSETQWNSFGA